jgi:hypothetical protein
VRLGPPRLRVEPGGAARLASQARALARLEAGEAAAAAGLVVVTFSLAGRPLAVEARVVERAVARLGAAAAVALAGGGVRLVAWVEDQPVAVADLAALAGLPPRDAASLAGVPALVLATSAGPVALAVEGPLSLADDQLALGAGSALAGAAGLGLAGRLASGAALLDGAWLAARAAAAGPA